MSDENEQKHVWSQIARDYEQQLANYAHANQTTGPQTALDTQVGGNHYKKFKIQPVEFCHVNKIPYIEATAIKYLCRWRDKGGINDLDKAIHFIQLLKQLEKA